MYSVDDFRRMFVDPIRHRAMVDALEESLTPGAIVLDLGSGPAMYGFHALRLGAGHVYAIEPHQAAVALGEQLALQNNLADRITFYSSMSFDVELPEKADVLVADLRDSVPFFQRNLDSIVDAKTRLLNADAIIVPRSDRGLMAPITSPTLRTRFSSWAENSAGIDTGPAAELIANQFHYDHLELDQLRAEPVSYGTVNYGVDKGGSTPVGWSGVVDITSDGIIDALGLWFESDLTRNVKLRSGPGGARIYRTKQLPIFPSVAVQRGDRFEFSLRADFTGSAYRWFWHGAHAGERTIRRCSDLAVVTPKAVRAT